MSRFFNKKTLIYTAYWILVTGFFLYEKKYLLYKANMPYFLACVSVRVILLMVIAYLNLHIFLPKYLIKKRYGAYAASILLSVMAYLVIQSLYDWYLYGYIVGPLYRSNIYESLYYNFFSTLWYLGLMLSLKLSIDWYSQQLLIQRITVEKLNAEVDFLRAQVNPHFLFNILNNLYALTLKKSEQAPDVVLKLSSMMEYMLYDSNDDKVLLDKELEYLQNYVALERLRFGNEAVITFNIANVPSGLTIAPLLLLPVVENAFKHGLSRQTADSELNIDIAFNDLVLTVKVENTRPLAPAEPLKGGIGLSNLRKRLALLYRGKHDLQLKDEPGRFSALLIIEL
ncbi:histidine kinase [Pedobacter kyungheensis]|uniref:Histidine kinase n=1 Tax=Pedobacter kyungheensis TaxID=1069985 RepID=A0A0C1FVB5_9SPHI|nr:histidine kinase [Pedobacter kyungheensis]KIA95813.1 histidine kinase [Pedobacter kyungheensis]